MNFLVYSFFLAPLALVIYLLIGPLVSPKARHMIRLRLKAVTRRPDLQERPYWLHAASGEFEYARPLLRELKSRHPETPILVTYTSPSFLPAIESCPEVDHAEPLPFDLSPPIKDFLNHYKPRALLIAKTDTWPLLLRLCGQHKVPRVLFSVSLTDQTSLWQKSWKKLCYSHIDFFGAVHDFDKDHLTQDYEITPEYIEVTGDTRYDQVVHRLHQATLPQRDDTRLCFLAGSTWPEDEKVLLPALSPLIKSKKLQLILVPHEVGTSHIQTLQSQLKRLQLNYGVYSEIQFDFSKDVLLVDQVGLLASLYPLADMSFVGGSFKKKVHSVMESLAAGALTIVGPNHQNNREAIEFQMVQPSEHWKAVNPVGSGPELTRFVHNVLAKAHDLTQSEALILSQVQRRTGATNRLIEALKNRGIL